MRFDGLEFTVFSKGNTKGIGSNRFDGLLEDRHGTLWALPEESWLVKYQAGVFTTYTPKEGLPSWTVLQIEEDEAGNLQVLSHEGIAKWKDGRFVTYALENLMAVSRRANWVPGRRLAWLGSDGLYLYAHGRLNTYSTQSGLPSLNIGSVFEDQHRTVWINARDAGLVRVKDGHLTTYPLKGAFPLKDPRGFTVPAQEDRKGNIWLAWGDEWLGRLKDGRLTRYTSSPGFMVSPMTNFYEDREGNFWVGAENGLYRAREEAVTVYTQQDGLSSDNVYSIYQDRAGQLWFGTWGGLTRYAEGQFRSYTEQDGLASDHIRALYEDADGILWIGTYDGGLGRFKDSRFTCYTTKNGLFNNGVFQILEDGRGYFWMSCNRGIYRVKRQELNDFANGKARWLTSVACGKNDGLLTLECNGGRQPAGWKGRDGRLWFPTAHGAAVIDPSRIELNQQPPPVV